MDDLICFGLKENMNWKGIKLIYGPSTSDTHFMKYKYFHWNVFNEKENDVRSTRMMLID